MKRKIGVGIMLLCLGVLAATVLAGCNTMKGVGEDVGAAGSAIERGSGR
jgi:predicted small secreted protein